MKIIYFGTPAFSTPFLQALLEEPNFDVVAVVTQPDKPAGRGSKIQASPVKQLAETRNVPVIQPASLKTPAVADALSAYEADLFIVVAYGKIIPKAVLEIPKLGCINVHPSLLPKYRGPSPMQWAIAQGDPTTGVSIMLLDEGMDTGPLLASESLLLDDEDTYESLQEKVHVIGPRLLVETIKRFTAGEIKPMPQDDAKASLTRLLDREDGRINWKQSMVEIERKIRAYQPWPGSWSIWNRAGEEIRLKILSVALSDFRADVPPGTVTVKDDRLFVDCVDGTLEILRLQRDGKPAMDATEFLRGHSDVRGATLV